MTPEAWLLWLFAALLAAGLAFWDFSTRVERSSRESPPEADEVSVEIVYE
jgi:hypothetical protein